MFNRAIVFKSPSQKLKSLVSTCAITRKLVKPWVCHKKLVKINDESFSNLSDVKVNKGDSAMNIVQYQSAPDRLEEMAEQETAKKKSLKAPKKCLRDVASYLPSSRTTERPFLKCPKNLRVRETDT